MRLENLEILTVNFNNSNLITDLEYNIQNYKVSIKNLNNYVLKIKEKHKIINSSSSENSDNENNENNNKFYIKSQIYLLIKCMIFNW